MARTPLPANSSATIARNAAVDLSAHMFKAVKLDANGAFVKAGAGEACTGILIDDPKQNETGTVQVKDIQRAAAGAAFAPGALLASDANSALVTAAAGQYILAKALQGAAGAGAIVEVQIIHAGWQKA